MRAAFFLAGLPALVLAACAQEAPEAPERETATSETTPEPSLTEPGAGDAVEIAATDRPDAMDGELSEAKAGGFSSAYTQVDLEQCTVTDSESEEGQWAQRHCPGYKGVRLFVDDGDGRFDVDAGSRNPMFETIGAFNDPPETVEWRLDNGVPFAVIYRLHDVSMESGSGGDSGRKRSVLFVESIGKAGGPHGCTVAQIAGDTPEPNRRARELADTTARDFQCTETPPVIVGDAR